MGEIGRWSGVKSKIGVGKDGNECGRKGELLGVWGRGRGENYVGLELWNGSWYGKKECVKVEDIDKVSYKYRFRGINSWFSFGGIGGE